MEQLISEIAAYADRRGIKPATVLQYSAGLSGQVWSRWQNGAQCTFATADRIRKYMEENPPVRPGSGVLACHPEVGSATADCKGSTS